VVSVSYKRSSDFLRKKNKWVRVRVRVRVRGRVRVRVCARVSGRVWIVQNTWGTARSKP
jgi:hypothetical protein